MWRLPAPTAVVSVGPFLPQMVTFFPDREETTLTALFAAVQQVQVESGWVEAVRCCSECTQGTSGPLIQPTEHTHSINLTRRLHLSTRADLNPSKCSESYTSGSV